MATGTINPTMKYDDSMLIDVSDMGTAAAMLDKLSRLKDVRRRQPLDMVDNIVYTHRCFYDEYNLQIGDSVFMIPPEFIMITSESSTQVINTLRQENSQKMKAGYHKRTLLIDLVFNGINQLNGFPVEGPEGVYYVDGLRSILAQFKCAPFLPIMNEYINGTYGIFTVALQSITMSTVNGFPNVMKAQLTLQEVNLVPYLEVPNFMFRCMIDWDLYRFYYQRFLTDKHVYKKLQALPSNKEHNHFRISILNPTVFTRDDKGDTAINEDNFLNIVTDKTIVATDENGHASDSNFILFVDSYRDNVTISDFQCGYSNMLANIQMSESEGPTLQFMGGMDTIYNISFETKDKSIVQCIEQCQVTNDLIIRNNIKLRSLGFVKLESELVEFTGSLFVMIDSVTTNTVPGFTDLYNVQINCVAFDIAQSEREELNGFMPFDCSKKHPHKGHEDQAIDQTIEHGLYTKARQDNYAEWKIRTTMEIYPDMHLPTYAEVNSFITKCIAFRSKHGLGELPYTQYPMKPFNKLFGNNPNRPLTVDKNLFYVSEVASSPVEYNLYVDPDFYVFYFNPYASNDYEYQIPQRESVTKTHTFTYTYGMRDDYYGYNGELVERMIAKAKTVIGHDYVWGAEGEQSTSKGIAFDCSGLISWLLKYVGLTTERFTVSSFVSAARNKYKDIFVEVPWEQRKRGDIVCFQTEGGKVKDGTPWQHIGLIIDEGPDKEMIHAGSPSSGVCYSTSASNYWSTHPKTCFRIRGQDGAGGDGGSNINVTVTGSSNEEQIWSGLKSLGLSDFAVAGVMGNMWRESNLNPDIYEMANNKWSGSHISYNKGYGLIQWTNTNLDPNKGPGRRDKFMNYFNNDASQYSTIPNQLKYLKYECTEGPDASYYRPWWDKTLNASSVAEATRAFAVGIEGTGSAVITDRINAAQQYYDKYAGKSSFSGSPSNSGSGQRAERPENVLSESEFNMICQVVQATADGEGFDTEQAVAQVIYDMMTDPTKQYGNLGNILQSQKFILPSDEPEITDSVEKAVRGVFCEGKKKWADKRALDLLSNDPTNANMTALYSDRDKKWPVNLGDVGQHTFWGRNGKGSDIKYEIVSDNQYAAQNGGTTSENHDVEHKSYAYSKQDARFFGEPTIARTADMMNGGLASTFISEDLNNGLRRYNSAFCDMYQYSARGTLLRAFPAFLLCILDDDAQWYDARKLWVNYYVYKSVVDINVHAANDMPTETATITITNSYHNLDQTQVGLSQYSIKNDEYYTGGFFGGVNKFIYENVGLMPGGLVLTDTLMELHQIIYKHAKLREGARIHLRMGYGSDPLSLAPVMNGHISDITLGDQITMVVTSDGHELMSHVVSSKETDTNNGFLGLFGLFEDQESSNIIANTLCERQSWVHHLCISGGKWFEASKYGIEHFGLFYKEYYGDIIDKRDQYDIVKNIYVANYGKESYVTGIWQYVDGTTNIFEGIGEFVLDIFGSDGEKNVVFNQYNMVPWDILQVCTQQVPEYICKPSYHQFDSRVYFGLPLWMEKNRYDLYRYSRSGKTELFEECKTAAQVFYLDSLTNIIDDQVRVTSKYTNTNVKVMYTLGSTVKSTDLLRSDSTIDFSYQKTAIIDSPVVQDALLFDTFYEWSGIQRTGYDSATRIGTSNLLYGWQQQYQGQLILNGMPGLKPHDYLMVNDTFASLYGVSIAREVIHSFNTMTGFTTSVTPGLIGFATAQNSGMIEQMQNMLALENSFAYMTAYRKGVVDACQQNIALISTLIVLQDKYDSAVRNAKIVGAIEYVARPGLALLKGWQIYNAIQRAGGLANLVSTAVTAFKAAGTIGKGILAGFNAVKGALMGTGAASGVGLVPSILITLAIQVVEIFIRDALLWVEHRNMIGLLPMWWEAYPFVSGVKGGEKILLVGSNATATGETDLTSDAIDIENTRFD